MYYSGQDVRINEFLIGTQAENSELDDEERELIKERDLDRLRKMTFYCFTNECLREYILRYFGEYGGNYCGNCENCRTEFEDMDVTEEACHIIRMVLTSHERYGINAVLDGVHGSDTAKVRQFRLNQNPEYGSLKDRTLVRLRQILNDLLLKEYLFLTTSDYPVLKMTKSGRELLAYWEQQENKAENPEEWTSQESQESFGSDGRVTDPAFRIILKLPKEQERTAAKGQEKKKKAVADAKYPDLFEQLRKYRYELAQKEHVPPYIIFSDKTLKELSTFLPTTQDAMLEINGIGKVKYDKYGERFMEIVRAYAEKM